MTTMSLCSKGTPYIRIYPLITTNGWQWVDNGWTFFQLPPMLIISNNKLFVLISAQMGGWVDTFLKTILYSLYILVIIKIENFIKKCPPSSPIPPIGCLKTSNNNKKWILGPPKIPPKTGGCSKIPPICHPNPGLYW